MTKNSREQRKKKILEVLNKARSMELQAIHQYMNQHYNLDDMDYGSQIAGTPADTGGPSKGFVAGGAVQ